MLPFWARFFTNLKYEVRGAKQPSEKKTVYKATTFFPQCSIHCKTWEKLTEVQQQSICQAGLTTKRVFVSPSSYAKVTMHRLRCHAAAGIYVSGARYHGAAWHKCFIWGPGVWFCQHGTSSGEDISNGSSLRGGKECMVAIMVCNMIF